MDIDRVNELASKQVIFFWFAGLAYYNWFTSNPISVPWWAHIILVVGGMFASSIVIGGGMALIAAWLTKRLFGRSDAVPGLFGWAGIISSILTFIAAKYALLAMRSLAAN